MHKKFHTSATLVSLIIVLSVVCVYLLFVIVGKDTKSYTTKIPPQDVPSIIALTYPQINTKNISDFEKVSLIREWASTHIPWGSDSTINNSLAHTDDLAKLFATLAKSKTSMNCAGVSDVLVRLYEEFGYKSISYHAGSLDAFNHVVTLVRINYDGKPILSIQDASFDVTYLHQDGTPYDFYDFLTALKEDRSNDIVILQGSSAPHDYVCDNNEACNRPLLGSVTPMPDGSSRYWEKFTTHKLANNQDIYLMYRGAFPETHKSDIFNEKKVLEIIQGTPYN